MREQFTVALVTTAAQSGGTWRHIRDLGAGLSERGASVIVSSPPSAQAIRDGATAQGLEWRSVRSTLRSRDIDVWHAHLHNTYDRSAAALLAMRSRVGPVVVTEHLPRSDASDAALGQPGESRRAAVAVGKTSFKRLELGLADQIITVSAGAARFISTRYGLGLDRLNVIQNGVPPQEAVQAVQPRSPLEVVAVGALSRQKGFDVLLDALRLSHGWNLSLYGEGAQLAALEARATAAPSDRLTLAGWADDPVARLREADLVCIPSRWESSSYVALEAGSVGRAVVASDIDGVNEIVVHRDTGLLVPSDDAQSLAAAIGELAGDPAAVAALGARALARVSTSFTLDRMVESTLDIYRRVL
jgi:glycosyltransferase involved in cell wall biosynthesis